MRSKSFERFAWIFLAYLIGVILYGAWVRITGSGAGCGSHWPLCDGEVTPLNPDTEKLIEYTHRVTSGLCGVFGLILVGWAWRIDRAGPMFRAAAWTLFFILVEGALGAVLVLQGLVADDDSAARALVVAIHLANTLALMAFAALTAWRAGGRPSAHRRERPKFTRRFALGLALIVITSMSGAVTALGDTLFPIEPAFGPGLLDKIAEGASSANHFLVRMRALHPAMALAAAAYWAWLLAPLARRQRRGWAAAALTLIALEVVAGVLNIALAAPGWLQIVHLFLAAAFWVAALLTGFSEATPRGTTSSD